MSVADEIERLLKALAPAPVCDDCIARKLNLSSRQQANQITNRLAKLKAFDRRSDCCYRCKAVKKVINFRSGNGNKTVRVKEVSVTRPRPSASPVVEKPISAPTLNDLCAIGFRRIGHWTLEGNRPRLHQMDMHKASPALYAYVIEDQIMYVGKTSQTLAKRFYFYENPGPRQSTNIRVNAHVKTSLAGDHLVEIYGYCNPTPTRIGAFELDMAAGLEDSIIWLVQPPWNKRK